MIAAIRFSWNWDNLLISVWASAIISAVLSVYSLNFCKQFKTNEDSSHEVDEPTIIWLKMIHKYSKWYQS